MVDYGEKESQPASQNNLKTSQCSSGAQMQNLKASSVKLVKKEVLRIRP